MLGCTFFKQVCERSHLNWVSQSGEQTKPGSTVTATFGILKSRYLTTNPPPKSLPSFLEMKPSASSRRYTMLMPTTSPSQSGYHHHYPRGGILLGRYNCRWTTVSFQNSLSPLPLTEPCTSSLIEVQPKLSRASSETGNNFCRSQEEAQVTCCVLAQPGG